MSTPPEHHLLDDPVQVVEESGRRRLLLLRGTNTERVVFFSDAVFASHSPCWSSTSDCPTASPTPR